MNSAPGPGSGAWADHQQRDGTWPPAESRRDSMWLPHRGVQKMPLTPPWPRESLLPRPPPGPHLSRGPRPRGAAAPAAQALPSEGGEGGPPGPPRWRRFWSTPRCGPPAAAGEHPPGAPRGTREALWPFLEQKRTAEHDNPLLTEGNANLRPHGARTRCSQQPGHAKSPWAPADGGPATEGVQRGSPKTQR